MIRRILTLFFTFAFFLLPCFSAQPKLIVLISLDQFRYDYIQRFQPYFGKGGFNYLLENGANFVNASFKHANNTTGPGHAAMFSGTYGNANGIIANDWYNRDKGEWVYCVEDKAVALVGSTGEGRSPRNFTGSTLGDEVRLKNGFNSKVISVSNKDRAAILMAGKMPNGAFWMMDSAFVTSTYYMNTLPDWVKTFNQSNIINSFFGKVWNKKLPDSAYVLMDDDDVPYEKDADGSGRTFPHLIAGLTKSSITSSYYPCLIRSPFGADVLKAFAEQAIDAEKLGQRGITDVLCVSFSSSDYVGHEYGPHSQEVMDLTVQLDAILADFFSFIDTRIGLKNCIVVLTADHGVGPIPEYLQRHQQTVDAGRISIDSLRNFCSRILTQRFGKPKPAPLVGGQGATWIAAIAANNIYLDLKTLRRMNIPAIELAAKELADSLRTFFPIAAAYTSNELSTMAATTPIEGKMKRSFNKLRSGDVVYALKPFWMEGSIPDGTTHGEPYDYDAHVPVILVGEGIRQGTYATEASPIDIAPTISALLGVEFPAGREGRVLTEALK